MDAVDILTPSLAKSLGLTTQRGMIVDVVVPGTPAAKAGLRGGTRVVMLKGKGEVGGSDGLLHAQQNYYYVGGDIILRIDGRPIRSIQDMEAFLKHATPGSVAAVRVLRGTKVLTLRVKLGDKTPNPWMW